MRIGIRIACIGALILGMVAAMPHQSAEGKRDEISAEKLQELRELAVDVLNRLCQKPLRPVPSMKSVGEAAVKAFGGTDGTDPLPSGTPDICVGDIPNTETQHILAVHHPPKTKPDGEPSGPPTIIFDCDEVENEYLGVVETFIKRLMMFEEFHHLEQDAPYFRKLKGACGPTIEAPAAHNQPAGKKIVLASLAGLAGLLDLWWMEAHNSYRVLCYFDVFWPDGNPAPKAKKGEVLGLKKRICTMYCSFKLEYPGWCASMDTWKNTHPNCWDTDVKLKVKKSGSNGPLVEIVINPKKMKEHAADLWAQMQSFSDGKDEKATAAIGGN